MEEKRTEWIQLRTPPRQKALWRAEALKRNQSLTDMIFDIVNTALGITNSDISASSTLCEDCMTQGMAMCPNCISAFGQR